MLLDPQRNLLTVLLVGVLTVCGLALVAQALLMGRPDIAAIAPAGGDEGPRAMVSSPETGIESLDAYAVITEHPLFFEDRTLPEIEPEDGPDDEAVLVEEEPKQPVEELKASIAGIIITPELRMALVNDTAANKTLVLREGMSLEGDQADWRLDAIAPRKASFVASDGKQAELELEVNTSAIDSGRRPSRPDSDGRQASDRSGQSDDADARARAEEVRRRVAERRAELRAEAERRARQARENNGDN